MDRLPEWSDPIISGERKQVGECVQDLLSPLLMYCTLAEKSELYWTKGLRCMETV